MLILCFTNFISSLISDSWFDKVSAISFVTRFPISDVRESNLAFIIDDDLVAMLSNLLDNAVEAAKNSKNAYINLSVKNEKSFVVLRVVNSCAVAPEANGKLLKTTKNDASVHGYGTKSIRKTAKKYNGICEWHYDETEGSFSFTILFNKYNWAEFEAALVWDFSFKVCVFHKTCHLNYICHASEKLMFFCIKIAVFLHFCWNE